MDSTNFLAIGQTSSAKQPLQSIEQAIESPLFGDFQQLLSATYHQSTPPNNASAGLIVPGSSGTPAIATTDAITNPAVSGESLPQPGNVLPGMMKTVEPLSAPLMTAATTSATSNNALEIPSGVLSVNIQQVSQPLPQPISVLSPDASIESAADLSQDIQVMPTDTRMARPDAAVLMSASNMRDESLRTKDALTSATSISTSIPQSGILNVADDMQTVIPVNTAAADTALTSAALQARADQSAPVANALNLQSSNVETPLSETLFWMMNKDMKHAQLRIDPPELGALDIHLEVDNNEVKVNMVTQSGVAKDALDSAMPRLREIFAENGMNLVQADVSEKQANDQNDQQAPVAAEVLDVSDSADSEKAQMPTTSTLSLSPASGRLDTYA